jgi:type II secretory pathway pseudopilin PulG
MSRASGFTYLGLLFLLAIASAGALLITKLYSLELRREKEAELLFVGEQYAAAIGRYREANSALPDPYPKELAALLRDPNAASTRRFLRRLYRDPLSGTLGWGFVRSPLGGIMGVYSLDERAPIKKAGFPAGREEFAAAARYAEWRFVARRP